MCVGFCRCYYGALGAAHKVSNYAPVEFWWGGRRGWGGKGGAAVFPCRVTSNESSLSVTASQDRWRVQEDAGQDLHTYQRSVF